MPFKDSRSVLGGGFRPHSLLKLSLKPEAEEQKRGQAAERLPGLDVECPEGRRPRQVRAQGGDAGRRGPVGRKLTHPGRQGPREANRPGRSPLGPPARARLPLKLRPKPAPASLPRPASSRTLTHSPDEPTHPDPGELILQPSARRRVGAVSHRDATGARFGLRPRRAAAPARSPVARPCDPRLARTDALEPEPAFLPAPFSPPSSLAERQQADSNLSSGRHRRHSRRGGREGGGAGSAAEPGGRGGPPRDAGLRARTGSAPAALRPGRERSRARGGSARRVCGAWRPAAGWEGPPPSWGRRAVVEGSSPPLGPASPSSPRSPTAAVVGRLVSGSRVKQTRCVGRTDTAAACCARAGPLGTESPQASPSVQTPLTNSYSM